MKRSCLFLSSVAQDGRTPPLVAGSSACSMCLCKGSKVGVRPCSKAVYGAAKVAEEARAPRRSWDRS